MERGDRRRGSRPANRDAITDWARNYYDALHPFGAGGAYVNFMMEEGEDRIRATYRGNYERLAAIKAKYDPENFFRVNQNIRPRATAKARLPLVTAFSCSPRSY